MSEENPGKDSKGGYVPDISIANKVRQMELQHDSLRLQMWLQFGVLALTIIVITVLASMDKLNATVATLLATLLGYVLRSTQDKKASK